MLRNFRSKKIFVTVEWIVYIENHRYNLRKVLTKNFDEVLWFLLIIISFVGQQRVQIIKKYARRSQMTTNKDMTLWVHEPENIHSRNVTLIFASQGKSDGIAAFGDNWTGTTFLCSAAQPQSKMNFELLHMPISTSQVNLGQIMIYKLWW